MGEMIVKMNTSEYKVRTYDEIESNLRFLKEFIGNATVSSIKELQDRARESDSWKAKCEELRRTIDEMTKNKDADIEKAVSKERIRLNRENEAETRDKIANAKKNESRKVKDTLVRPLQVENDNLKEQIERLLENDKTTHAELEKANRSLEELKNGQREILEENRQLKDELMEQFRIINASASIEEVREQVATRTRRNMSDAEKEEVYEMYKRYATSGMTDRNIAERLMTESKSFSNITSVDSAVQKLITVKRWAKERGV